MEKKFGRERVARLGSVSQFKSKSALNQVSLALRIPQWQIDKVSEATIKRSMGDSRADSTIEDTLRTTDAGKEVLREFPEAIVAARMENHPSNPGQHAAGMVLTNEPIAEYVAVNMTTGSAMCDKYDAETLNLLKIDALGLTQLSIFERVLELLGEEIKSGWLEKIPLDDPAAFAILNDGKFSGIFQFVGSASKGVTKQIRVEKFDDLVAITALARPGPLASGGTDTWIKRRNGKEVVKYPHPIFEPYLKDTLGIPIYQEQVLNIGREIGDLSWEAVTKLRQAMSRSLGKEFFDQFGDPWKAAAIKKGVPAEVLDEVWDDLTNYGAWAFNKAHSVAYAMIGYWCCWLKAHHPIEFAAATLDSEGSIDRQLNLLRELKSEGIDYIPLDSQRSTEKWEPAEIDGKKVLMGPLINVTGIGPAAVLEILDSRKNGTVLKKSIEKKLSGAKTPIDSLVPIDDAFRRKYPTLEDANIVTTPTKIKEVQPGISGDIVIIAVPTKIMPTDENAPVKVAKRNGRVLKGQTMSLNMFVKDDTDEMFVKIPREQYERLGIPVAERGEVDVGLYAIKGYCPGHFRMLWVKNIRYLGRIDE
jgi:DNA polymerase-3 subunit alpha